MRNLIVEAEVARERAAFIQSLNPQAICELASSYNNGVGCQIFGKKHGSFNICFFVEFESHGGKQAGRWVVRIPFPKRVPWVDEKVDSEVATMKYIRQKTTIPVPEVIAYSYTANSPIGQAFIITEYVEGTTLRALGYRNGKRWQDQDGDQSKASARVYSQLADVYIQLRGLEFTTIGALSMPTSPDEDIAIRHRPLAIEAVLQQVDGLDPAQFFPEGKTFETSREYVVALARLAWNLLLKTRHPDIGPSEKDAAGHLYAYIEFCNYVGQRWTTKRGNLGPFVLMHGDMVLHDENLLWDDDLNLRAVIDWEWTCTVPVQCFIPPAWLDGFRLSPIAGLSIPGRTDYETQLSSFCTVLAERCAAISPESSLPSEWRQIISSSRHLIVLALRYPDAIIDVYWNLVDFKLHPVNSVIAALDAPRERAERVEKFSTEERLQNLLQRKLSEQKEFDAEYEGLYGNMEEPRFCQCDWCREKEEAFKGRVVELSVE